MFNVNLASRVVILWFASSLAIPTAQGQVLHAVLAMDTKITGRTARATQTFQESIATDLMNVRMALADHIPQRQLKIIEITDDDLNWDFTSRTIRTLNMSPNDALMVFYGGHGGFDRSTGNYHYSFTSSNEHPTRQDFVKLIRSHDVRLGVLITNACSSVVGQPPAVAPRARASRVDRVAPICDALFFRPTGFVDLSATKLGQAAAATRQGSPFVTAVKNTLYRHKQQNLSWRGFTAAVRNETDKELARLKSRNVQAAILFADPKIVPKNKRKLGADVRATPNHRGVLVHAIEERSLASEAGLAKGDIIVAFDGKPIRTYQDIRPLVGNAQGVSSVDVLRGSERRTITIHW